MVINKVLAVVSAGILIALTVGGCAPEVAEQTEPVVFVATPAHTPTPTSTPAPSPTPIGESVLNETAQGFVDEFKLSLNLDLTPYLYSPTEDDAEEIYGYLTDEDNIANAQNAADYVNMRVLETLETLASDAGETLGLNIMLTSEVAPVDHKYMAAYLISAASTENPDMFGAGADIDATLDAEGNMNVSGHFDYGTFATEYLNAYGQDASDGFMTYCYLQTVFDDEGTVKEYTLPPISQPLVYPVPGHIDLRDGWYDNRDDGTRFHTGMDIRAPEGADIVSCTDGVVEKVLYNDKAGNYVQIIDEYGYRYFYCHMVRLPDFIKPGDYVKAGDVIGPIGNTGNSTANHLHLTIMTDDGYLVNPYEYIVESAENE